MGEYEGVGSDDTKQYDEIRAIASKNWMSSASVSLAKLDEVKAKVYNMGLTDASSLKPKSGSKTCGKEETSTGRKATTRWASAEPPLSRVAMQNNAWCTSTAVPPSAPRVRQQCEQQKSRSRPESAKNQNNGAKVQLKRRPHSAVIHGASSVRSNPEDPRLQDVLIQDEVEEGQSVLGVHGAKFDPGERPDHYSTHQTSLGYVASGSKHGTTGRYGNEQEVHTPQRESQTRTTERPENKPFVIQIPGEEAETDLPPAPCTSPDLTQFQEGELLIGQDRPEDSYTPTQTVYVNLPHPDQNNDSLFDGETNLWDDNEQEVMTQIQAEGATENLDPEDKVSISTSHTGKVFSGQANRTVFSELSEELNQEVHELKQELQRNVHRPGEHSTRQAPKQRPKSAKNTVQFDEQSNMTIKITPRVKPGDTEDAENMSGTDAWPQPYTGARWDLRHVQSRTNSGIALSKTHAKMHSKVRRPSNTEGQGRPTSAKVPTVSVNYLEDSDDSETEDTKMKNGRKSGKNSRIRGSCDIETMVSRGQKKKEGHTDDLSKSIELEVKGNIDLGKEGQTEDGEEGDLEPRSLSRAGSPAKCFSSSEKNYYQLAIKTGAKQKGAELSHVTDSKLEAEQEVRKTVKTLELLDGRELKEMKVVSMLGAQEHRTKDYVAPRPVSAQRVSSPHKSQTDGSTASEKKSASRLHEKPGQSKQTGRVNSRPQSAVRKVDRGQKDARTRQVLTEHQKVAGVNGSNDVAQSTSSYQKADESQEVEHTTGFTHAEEERPGSRMGFRGEDGIVGKQMNTESKPTAGLQKRRATSAVVNPAIDRRQCHLGDKRGTNVSSTKSRPLSAHLSGEKEPVSSSCGRHKMASPGKPSGGQRPRKESVTDILAQANNFKGCANLTANKLGGKKIGSRKEAPASDVVQIWTRQDEYEFDTDGMKECREIQDQLIDSGVPVSIYALKRALLPPTEYNWRGPSYKSNMTPIHPQYNTSAGLISKPEMWLPQEHQKVKDAQRKVRVATELLLEQERERREQEYSASVQKRKSGGKKRKSTKRK